MIRDLPNISVLVAVLSSRMPGIHIVAEVVAPQDLVIIYAIHRSPMVIARASVKCNIDPNPNSLLTVQKQLATSYEYLRDSMFCNCITTHTEPTWVGRSIDYLLSVWTRASGAVAMQYFKMRSWWILRS